MQIEGLREPPRFISKKKRKAALGFLVVIHTPFLQRTQIVLAVYQNQSFPSVLFNQNVFFKIKLLTQTRCRYYPAPGLLFTPVVSLQTLGIQDL